MGRAYSAGGRVTAGVNKSAIQVNNPATTRARIFEIIIGCQATPAAQAALWLAARATSGVGSAVTPIYNDTPEASLAALCSAIQNQTTEPTYTSGIDNSIWAMPLNQQATFNWKANQGRELVTLAGATQTITLYINSSTGTAVHQAMAYFEE